MFGLERGFCLMIGGEDEVGRPTSTRSSRTIAPGRRRRRRAPRAATGDPTPAEQGYLHCGPNGAGHFVKMVHNGIEYGLMAAYAEGLNILQHADVGKPTHEVDAETTPLRDPEYYQYDIDVAEVAEVWRRGSVVASWLLDLTAAALHADPELDGFAGRVSRLGRGPLDRAGRHRRGRARAACSPAALFERFSSRGEADFADKLLSAMRKEFGGHDEKPGAAGHGPA